MSSGIPPLLPASPPPMYKVDFDEDEFDNDDENEDDFGDFSTAVPNHITPDSVCENDIPNEQNHSLHVITPSETDVENTASKVNPSSSFNHVDQISNCISEPLPADIIASTEALRLENQKSDTKPTPNLFSPLIPVTTSGDDSDCDKPDSNSVREHSSTISSKSVSADDLSIELVLPPCEDKVEDNTSENFYDMGFCINERTQVSESGDQLYDFKMDHRTNSVLELGESTWDEIEVTKHKQHEIIVDSNQQVTKIDDEMGDFEQEVSSGDVNDYLFAVSSENEEPSINEQNAFESAESRPVTTESIRTQEYFNEDDDDFSDFVSPSSFESSKPSPTLTNDSTLKNDSYSSYQKPSSPVLINRIDNWNEIFETQLKEAVEVNLNPIEGRLNGSSIWCRIKDIHASPALNYTWAESETNKMLLSTLYIDTRNILFGPRWNSEVPRFASNLGFTPLVPQKTSNKKDELLGNSIKSSGDFSDSCCTSKSTFAAVIDEPHSSKMVSTSVPDAHFDWNNSGLTNPLDSHTNSSLLDLDLLANFDIHSRYYKEKRKSTKQDEDSRESNYENFTAIAKASRAADSGGQRHLSQEARNVLDNLPDLVVMEKQYIVFPIR